MNTYSIIISLLFLFACKQKEERFTVISAKLEQLNDKQYPNNPDINYRSSLSDAFKHDEIQFIKQKNNFYTITVLPGNDNSDTLIFHNIDLKEFIPAIPENVKKDEYLEEICVINQEWNRQQVRFMNDEFHVSGNGKEREIVKRVDIARNCLNAGLWEVVAYNEEDGELKPYYHGWFDFPKAFYAQLFEEKNKVTYAKWHEFLDDWRDPKSEVINLNLLRQVIDEKEITLINLNHEFYPIKGARKKKYKNIISPKTPKSINDFLNDNTTFATFTPPGTYDTEVPRETELSLLSNPESAILRNVYANDDTIIEIEIVFEREADKKITRFIIGGIQTKNIPQLDTTDVNSGLMMPMGIANHGFYETYKYAIEHPAMENHHYNLLLDKDGKWLDSHKIGIDGPLLHYDINDHNKLHIWVLSFERHAFVGHYVLALN